FWALPSAASSFRCTFRSSRWSASWPNSPMGEIAVIDRRIWLQRLIHARLFIFTILCTAEATRPANSPFDMLVLAAAVYALSVCWYLLLRLNRGEIWQSYLQLGVDLL